MKNFIKNSVVTIGLMCIVSLPVFASGKHDPNDHVPSVQNNNENEKPEQTEFGVVGDPKHISKTVVVEMSDTMKFSSGDLKFKQGETVKFVVKNNEKMKHEMVVSTMDEIKEHAEYMKKFPNMEHSEPNMTSVEPGKTKDIVWKFNKKGEFYYACLVPGHMEAGMINKIIVD